MVPSISKPVPILAPITTVTDVTAAVATASEAAPVLVTAAKIQFEPWVAKQAWLKPKDLRTFKDVSKGS